jgi:putative MATE family efflux protein
MNLVYNLVDMFWLGRVGRVALAAVSASWPVVWLIIAGAFGVLAAGISLVSQYWGAGDRGRSMEAAGQVILIVLVLGSAAAMAGFILVPHMLFILGVPQDILGPASDYAKIFSLGILFIGLYQGSASIYSAAGDTITPLKLRALGVGLNIILDPLLIMGYFGFPKWGVVGAAVATVISQGVAAAASLIALHYGVRGEKLGLHHLRPRFDMLKKLVKVGAPISILPLGEAGGFSVLVAVISMSGSAALAAWGIGDRPLGLFHIFISGLLGATSTIIGQSLGAGMIDRAKEAAKKTTLYGMGIMILGVGVLIPFRYQVAAFFAPSDPLVIDYAADFILIMGPSVVFFTIYLAANSVAHGSGHTKPAMVMGLIRLWVLRNILAYYFGPGPLEMGVPGLWLGMAISNFITGAIALLWIFGGSWAKPIIEKERGAVSTENDENNSRENCFVVKG